MAALERINGNTLKIIALVSMTVDHIGVFIFPEVLWLRIVGRLAFPIFAYMIAEGCFYTKSRKRYLGLVIAAGVFCQAIAFISERSLSQCILVTFAMSIAVIFLLDEAVKARKSGERAKAGWLTAAFALSVAVVYAVCSILPNVLKNYGFCIDYGFWGVMLPVIVYIPSLTEIKSKYVLRLARLALMAAGLAGVSLTQNIGCQWWSFISLALLLFYNGRRGKLKLKYLFYIYYPVHLGIIYLISTL